MKRPISVTLLLWLVLIFTVWAGMRLVTTVQFWLTIRIFASPPGPLYIAVSGFVWLAIGIILLWSMWRKKVWARSTLLGASAGFSVWYWCDRLLLQNPRPDWLFSLAGTALLLIIVTISLVHPQTKHYFSQREKND